MEGVSKWELYEPEVPSDGSSRPLTSMSGLGLARDGEAGPLSNVGNTLSLLGAVFRKSHLNLAKDRSFYNVVSHTIETYFLILLAE